MKKSISLILALILLTGLFAGCSTQTLLLEETETKELLTAEKETISHVDKTEEKAEEKTEEKGRDYKERKRQEAEKRKILNRYAKVEELIDTTEKKIAELEAAYNDPGIASDYEKLGEISGQIDALKGELDGLME